MVGSGVAGALPCCDELFLEDCPVNAFQRDDMFANQRNPKAGENLMDRSRRRLGVGARVFGWRGRNGNSATLLKLLSNLRPGKEEKTKKRLT